MLTPSASAVSLSDAPRAGRRNRYSRDALRNTAPGLRAPVFERSDTMPSQNRGSSQTVKDHDTVSQLLIDLRGGDQDALNQLLPLVYHQLHTLAQQQRRKWTGDETLDTTALVHEAYLRLAGDSSPSWENRAHFLAVASRAMRHILVDYAKQRRRAKRGGDRGRVPLEEIEAALEGGVRSGGCGERCVDRAR